MSERTADDVYSRVTNHIVAAVERGAAEYRMPWHMWPADTVLPLNVASGQHYRGVNVLCLWASAQEKGCGSALWGTYRQWQDLGGNVRKGEKATPVVFWKEVVGKGEQRAADDGLNPGDEKREKWFVAKGYWVFNASQVEGYSRHAAPKLPDKERVWVADDFLFGLGADIRHGGVQACYWPNQDYIQMPPYDVFMSVEGYYGTLAHELTHWTGAPGRLGRDLHQRFGSAAYAAEELVAELGAAFQLARLGLCPVPRLDHASYIASWLTLLKNDTKAIFTAAGKAQGAVDWLEQKHALIQEARPEAVIEHER
jgi:antirestriction protein ArdC